MAKPTIIYKGAFSGFWFGLAMATLCGVSLTWIRLTWGLPLPEAIWPGALAFLGLTSFVYLLGWLSTRKSVATLATDGTALTGWMAGPAGRGRRFAVPIAEIDKWRWFDARKQRNVVAVLEFAHGGAVYRISPYGARRLDVDAFRKLAPLVVSDAVIHSSASLIGIKYPSDGDGGLD